MLNIPEIISLYASILLFILGFIFALYRSDNRNSNKILAAFLFSNALLLGRLFVAMVYPSFHDRFTVISMTGKFCYILLSPLLYLYIVSLNDRNFRFTIKSLIHLIPFLIFFCMAISAFILSFLFNIDFKTISDHITNFYKIALHIIIAVYLFFSFRLVRIHQREITELRLSRPLIDLSWVYIIIYCFFLMWLLDLTNILINKTGLNLSRLSHALFIMSLMINFMFCIFLVYKGFSLSKIVFGISEFPKYLKYNLEIKDYKIFLEQLLEYMEREKPYLLPELTLEELADLIHIPYKQLSQTIHVCLNQNFKNFLNTYRINEAKMLLASDPKNKKTILNILLSSGFNTKSVFNKTFKEKVGHTPKVYKKSLKNTSVKN